MGLAFHILKVAWLVTFFVTPLWAQTETLCGIDVASASRYFHAGQGAHHDLAQAAGFLTLGGVAARANSSHRLRNDRNASPAEFTAQLANKFELDSHVASVIAPQCLIDRGAIRSVNEIPWDTIHGVSFYVAPGRNKNEFRILGRSSFEDSEDAMLIVRQILAQHRSRARILEGELDVKIENVQRPLPHRDQFLFEATVRIQD